MDCAKFESLVHDLDRPGTPAAQECESALAHAESCSNCAALLTQVEWLELSLVKLAERAGDSQASPRVEAALLQEFRNAKSVAARKQIRLHLAALAVAAALFLALGLSLRHRGLPLKGSAPDLAIQSARQNSELATTAPVLAGSDAASQNMASDASDSDDSDDTASFTRLPFSDDFATVDGGAIVRVEIPRATLASFGLPVADTGGTQRILADLVVSADGTPEAIRLVSQTSANQEF